MLLNVSRSDHKKRNFFLPKSVPRLKAYILSINIDIQFGQVEVQSLKLCF